MDIFMKTYQCLSKFPFSCSKEETSKAKNILLFSSRTFLFKISWKLIFNENTKAVPRKGYENKNVLLSEYSAGKEIISLPVLIPASPDPSEGKFVNLPVERQFESAFEIPLWDATTKNRRQTNRPQGLISIAQIAISITSALRSHYYLL